MKVKYFNITYRCNSACLFCAANIGLYHKNDSDMSINDFVDAIRESNLQPGDRIILNGGEPTMCSDFLKMIEYCDSNGYLVDIYSNGKRFFDIEFCTSVFKDGKYYVRIPLFGLQSQHDYLTGKSGNFDLTVGGIYNLLNTQAFSDGRMDIEIKLLLARCCVKENVELLQYIIDRSFLGKVSISLNPLLISQKVINNASLFVDTYSEMIRNSQKLFLIARKYNISISTDLLPYCVFPKDFFDEQLFDLSRFTDGIQVEYTDAKVKKDQSVMKGNHTGSKKCELCRYKKACPKFPLSYLEYFGDREIQPFL